MNKNRISIGNFKRDLSYIKRAVTVSGSAVGIIFPAAKLKIMFETFFQKIIEKHIQTFSFNSNPLFQEANAPFRITK